MNLDYVDIQNPHTLKKSTVRRMTERDQGGEGEPLATGGPGGEVKYISRAQILKTNMEVIDHLML